tara:strand:- start:31759 stop:32397 length:639 start_codon:yes stop_codon:yes gene_type:complete
MVKLSSTEEEYTEFLSSLWQRYKYLLLLSVVLIGGGVVGWDAWTKNQTQNFQESSDLYEEFIDSLNNQDSDEKLIADQIINKHPNTLYADLVSLHLAKISAETDDLNAAEKNLKWVLKRHEKKWSSDFDPIEITARIRLARVLLAKESPEEALEIINQAKEKNSALYEVKGDAEELLGQFDEARLSYLKALESTQNQSIRALLQMKLSSLEG